ncbi:glycosyltransferase [Candidatus Giovannonibacteria bacterium]|nr:glycosyltransferase [Candidatus Giovannonibacteria bacterium]
MKIGLLMPSVYMGRKYKDKIFAPKELFLHLADGLVTNGHTVFVYAAPDTKTKAHLITGEGALVERDFISPKFRGLDRLAKLKNAHTATKIEYEIDLTVKAFLHAKKVGVQIMHAYHDFMAHYVNHLSNLPTVYTVHDPRPRPEHIEHWRFKHFPNDNYIFISQSQKQNFRELIHSIGVVYHGLDTGTFSFDKQGGTYLGFIGRYIKEKGVVEAISAATSVGLPLKMVSDDAYRALAYYQKNVLPRLKKGVVEDETFYGENDRGKFFRNAFALLFPIQWEEPFGMVMIEAMSCGTPVIAFDRGSVSEVVKNGETGFVVPPKEGVAGIVKAIKRLQGLSPEAYQAMRLACRKHVEDNFTITRMVADHERLYKAVIEKSKHRKS